jgi:hypothetical protein
MNLPTKASQWLDGLRRSIATGLPQLGMGWASALAKGFPREFALALLELDVTSPDHVSTLSASRLEEIVPKVWHRFFPGPVSDREAPERKAEDGELRLRIDWRRPDRVSLNDTMIPVSQKQFQLLAFLASKPGECQSYDTLLDNVWQGVIVEQSQIPKLKSLICKRARQAVGPAGERILRTIPGRGLILEAHTEVLPTGPAG